MRGWWLGLLVACDGGEPEPTGPTLSGDVQPLFSRNCATYGCHGGPELQTGLDLNEGAAHGSLVGVASAQRPEMLRVAPGEPDASYLLVKMRGEADEGDLMPPGFAPLAETDLSVVEEWIAAGALDD